MDELELIRSFRARVSDPDPAGVQAARAALLERGGRGRAGWRPRSSMGHPRRRWALTAGVAAAAVALAVALPSLLPGGHAGGADPAAAAVLRSAAAIAANQPAEPPPVAGQFVYTKTQDVQTSLYSSVEGGDQAFSFTAPATREIWIGPDGSGRLAETAGEVSFPTAQDRAGWVAAGSPDLTGSVVDDQTYGPGGLFFLDPSGLPTDPGKLRTVIEEGKIEGGPPGDWETFAIVGDLLRETYAPPALRAALYEVAANLPGVEYVGRTTDGSGRPGVAVAYTHDGSRNELIFDPNTAALLGENDALSDPTKVPVPNNGSVSVSYSAVYLDAGIVSSIQAKP